MRGFVSKVVGDLAAAAKSAARMAENRGFRRAVFAGLRNRVAANWIPIVISVAIASVVYSRLHQRPDEKFVRNVAVSVARAPEGSVIATRPSTVRVTFAGARQDILGLDMLPPKLEVAYPSDTNGLSTVGKVVRISRKNVRFASMRGFGTARVIDIEPNEVTISEDKTESRTFGIETPVLEGVPLSGYIAKVSGYSPDKATVTGGGSRLKAWEELGYRLRTPPISVDGRGADFTQEVEILPPRSEDALNITLPAEKVKVDVSIVKLLETRVLEGIPVRLSFPQDFSFPDAVAVEPRTVAVTLVGAEGQFKDVGPDDVAVYAEVASDAMPPGATNAVEVALVARIPQDMSITEVNLAPASVTLTAIDLGGDDAAEEPPAPEPEAPAPEDPGAAPAPSPAQPSPVGAAL